MRRLLGASLGALAFAVAAAGVSAQEQPSFDCSKAQATVEVLICNDSELMRLDGALGAAYAGRREAARGAARDALLRDQRQWLPQRLSRCDIPERTDALTLAQRCQWGPCLAEMYEQRLVALGAGRPGASAPPAETGRAGYIHPLCLQLAVEPFFGEGGPPRAVRIEACNRGNRHVPVEVTTGGRSGKMQLSAMGAEQGWRDWIGYQPLGQLQRGQEPVLVYYSGGGTGTFSAIFIVRRARDPASGEETITADRLIGGGDRCEGGIESAEVIDEKTLRYGLNVPAPDFVSASGAPVGDVNGLSTCAVCCYAVLDYRHTDGGSDDVLLDARIAELQDQDDMPQQRCLDAIVRKAAGGFPATLSATDMKHIGESYAQQCSKRMRMLRVNLPGRTPGGYGRISIIRSRA